MFLVSRANPRRILTTALAVLLAGPAARAQMPEAPAAPPSFVVAPFDTDRTGWMPPPRFGDTIAELLAARLTAEGMRVIDHTWLTGGTLRESPDNPVARLAGTGADYVVLGSVARLSLERHSSSGVGLLPSPVAAGLVRRQRTATAIVLSVRVVDARIGTIVRSATTEGGSDQQNTSGGGLALLGKLPLIGGRRSSSTGIHDRLLGEALVQAIDLAAAEVAATAAGRRPAPGGNETDN